MRPARDDRRRLLALDRGAVEADRAARARTMPEMRAVERRFADAVGAEHGDDLARRDIEVDAAQHFGLAIAGAQPANVEQRAQLSGMRAPYSCAAPWPR